jgi:hypothetical protein
MLPRIDEQPFPIERDRLDMRRRLGCGDWFIGVQFVSILTAALQLDYVVLDGGNANQIKALPLQTRLGDNNNALSLG